MVATDSIAGFEAKKTIVHYRWQRWMKEVHGSNGEIFLMLIEGVGGFSIRLWLPLIPPLRTFVAVGRDLPRRLAHAG